MSRQLSPAMAASESLRCMEFDATEALQIIRVVCQRARQRVSYYDSMRLTLIEELAELGGRDEQPR